MITDSSRSLQAFDWFPKRFAPGDMDATSGERLLGRTELSPLEVLIRETAQNSWDAKSGTDQPHYGLHLRYAGDQLRDDIANLLAGPRPLTSAVDGEQFVLEIFDRGTTGLDGPVTLEAVPDEVPRNYQDLILKLGVPRDDGKGGGTYGFGKTAAFAFSSQGTLVFWTRCRNELGRLEHRIVASAFRDAYSTDGVQFTGRHWWGRVQGEMVLPIIGADAEHLGRRLFDRDFGPDETGTSILVVAPDLSHESLGIRPATGDEVVVNGNGRSAAADFAEEARTAIRRHLWPKLVPAPGDDRAPMGVSLTVEGSVVELDGDGALGLWGAALNAIRSEREGAIAKVTTPQGMPVRVVPISRRRAVIGHIAIVQRVLALESGPSQDDLDPALNADVHRVALMRGQTELVVTTENWFDQVPLEGSDWLAVFKSTDEFDAAFARTEPPAHDAWVASAAGDDGLIVRHTRSRVIAAIRDVLSPGPASEREAISLGTAVLSQRFRGMLPAQFDVDAGAASGPGVSGRRSARQSRGRRVELADPRLIATYPDGRQRQRLDFVVRSGEPWSLVKVTVSVVGDDGLLERLPPESLDVAWLGVQRPGIAEAVVADGYLAGVEVTGVVRRALRIDLVAESLE